MFGSLFILFVVAVNRSELSRKPKSPQPADVKAETPSPTGTTPNDPNTGAAAATAPTADSPMPPAAAATPTADAATATAVSGSAAEVDKTQTTLATRTSIEDTSPKCYYDLFGTANHVGSMESGHYVSNVNVDGIWYHCNDAHVSKTEESNILHNKEGTAYVLFYARRSAGAK